MIFQAPYKEWVLFHDNSWQFLLVGIVIWAFIELQHWNTMLQAQDMQTSMQTQGQPVVVLSNYVEHHTRAKTNRFNV